MVIGLFGILALSVAGRAIAAQVPQLEAVAFWLAFLGVTVYGGMWLWVTLSGITRRD